MWYCACGLSSISRRYGKGEPVRKYGVVLFVAALTLMPSLAKAGGTVPMQEPGTVSLLGAGLLAFACISGVLTVNRVIASRRSRVTSTNQL